MSDYLDRLEAQLSELTEDGAHQRRAGRAGPPPTRRPRRPAVPPRQPRSSRGPRSPRGPRRGSEALAFLAATVVVAAVVAIVLVNVHGGNTHSTTTASSATHAARRTTTRTTPAKPPAQSQTTAVTPGVVPANFAPQSFTAIGELTWWLLGAGPCGATGHAPCGAILQTTDGGRTFTGIHAPAAPLVSSGGSSGGYSQIALADTHNGFAYGPDLYSTHDGGQTWQQLDVGGNVGALVISAGTAYAVVASTGGAGGKLMHSPVGHDDWTPVPAAGAVGGGLWVQGSNVIVQSGAGSGVGGNVLVSHDGGSTFASYASPSPGFPCIFQAPVPPVVWAQCPTGTESGVWRSSDGGAHFTIAAGTGTSLHLPNSAPFAAASDTTAVLGAQELYRSSNSGALWSPVGPSGIARWAYLGFTDATHGVALGYEGSVSTANERLYYTTDGGQTYHLVPLP